MYPLIKDESKEFFLKQRTTLAIFNFSIYYKNIIALFSTASNYKCSEG
jgi:hypothetical protein